MRTEGRTSPNWQPLRRGDHEKKEKIFEVVGTPLCILYYREKDVVS